MLHFYHFNISAAARKSWILVMCLLETYTNPNPWSYCDKEHFKSPNATAFTLVKMLMGCTNRFKFFQHSLLLSEMYIPKNTNWEGLRSVIHLCTEQCINILRCRNDSLLYSSFINFITVWKGELSGLLTLTNNSKRPFCSSG